MFSFSSNNMSIFHFNKYLYLMFFGKMGRKTFVRARVAAGRVRLKIVEKLRIFGNLIFSVSSHKFLPQFLRNLVAAVLDLITVYWIDRKL